MAPVAVTVNASAGLATVPDTGIGANDAIWDSQLGTDEPPTCSRTPG